MSFRIELGSNGIFSVVNSICRCFIIVNIISRVNNQ